MNDLSSIAARIAHIRDHIEQLTREAGRPPGCVALLPVSKTFGSDAVRQALAAGLHRFGENKVQEIRDKSSQLADADVQWVMIGHLQTNKARDVARYAHEIQSLDRVELAVALDKRLEMEGRSLDALVQIKTSNEPSKFGLAPAELEEFLHFLATEAPRLRVQGLMTLATNDEDRNAVRACFRRLRELRDTAQAKNIPGVQLERLSMGMSGDYDLAISEGSTEVRIGSAIFGGRSYT